MQTITHIIFDLSEVIISGLVGIEDDMSALTGEPKDKILKKFGGTNLARLCKNEINEDEYLERLIKRENWSCSKKQLKRIIRNNFHHVIDSMDGLIGRLSQKYNCILLSDHAIEWIEYIENYHKFLGTFSYRLYSFITGHIKDDEYNFRKILKDLQITAENCVFIDDSPKNVAIANLCGIHGIVFKNQQQLVQDLSLLGISV